MEFSWLLLFLTLPSCYAIVSALCVMTRRVPDNSQTGGIPSAVSVLKPLCGSEPRLYDNLATFCVQSHSRFQVLLGVASPDDPAVEVARRLCRDFPERDISVHVDRRRHGANLKVSTLINLLPLAKYDVLVVADSDISVGPEYLGVVTRPLRDPSVGAVTCLYRARAVGRLWASLGALFVNEWFQPLVRLDHAIGSTDFGFGATLVFRRSALAASGGFEALRNHVADDYWLARHIRGLGLRTVLSGVVVTTDVTETRFAQLWAREVRWLRTIRSVAPRGFAFLFVTFTVLWALPAVWLVGPQTVIGWVVAAGLLARLALHRFATRSWRECLLTAPLVPVRDMLLLAQWITALRGSTVVWRGRRLTLGPDLLPHNGESSEIMPYRHGGSRP